MPSFHTTLWTQIGDVARRDPDAAHGFVERYHAPLLQFLRRRGVPDHEIEDVIQDVFLRLFERDLLAKADRARGRFRSYLLGITKHVLLKRRDRR